MNCNFANCLFCGSELLASYDGYEYSCEKCEDHRYEILYYPDYSAVQTEPPQIDYVYHCWYEGCLFYEVTLRSGGSYLSVYKDDVEIINTEYRTFNLPESKEDLLDIVRKIKLESILK